MLHRGPQVAGPFLPSCSPSIPAPAVIARLTFRSVPAGTGTDATKAVKRCHPLWKSAQFGRRAAQKALAWGQARALLR